MESPDDALLRRRSVERISTWYQYVAQVKRRGADQAFGRSRAADGVDILLSPADVEGIQLYQSNTVSRRMAAVEEGGRKRTVPCVCFPPPCFISFYLLVRQSRPSFITLSVLSVLISAASRHACHHQSHFVFPNLELALQVSVFNPCRSIYY